jgi:hypothetical protein
MVRRILFLVLVMSVVLPGVTQVEWDARLNKEVSLRVEVGSIGGVLKQISEETGVQLQAERDISEDLLVLVARAPAREILEKIGEHFGWSWRLAGDTYVLYRSEEARKKEEQLFRDDLLKPYRDRQEVARKLRQTARETPLEELKKELEQLEARMGEPMVGEGVAAEAGVYRPTPRDIRRQFLLSVLSPMDQLSAEAFLSLDEDALYELALRHRLVLSTHPTVAQRPLKVPADLLSAGVAYICEQVNSRRELIAKIFPKEKVSFIDPKEVAVVRLVFEHDSFYFRQSVFEQFFVGKEHIMSGLEDIRFELLSSDGRVLYNALGRFDFVRDLLGPFWKRSDDYISSFIVERERKRARNALDEKDLDVSRIPGFGLFPDIDDSFGGAVIEIQSWRSQPRRLWRLMDEGKDPLSLVGEFLTGVAEQAGVFLISDLYDVHERRYWGGSRFRIQHLKVGEVLDRFCQGLKSQWTLSGNWVGIRTEDWALARRGTVPRSLFFYAVKECRQKGGLSLDETARLLRQLNDFQVWSLIWYTLDRYSPCLRPKPCDYLYAFRFWDAIGPQAREALRQGQTLVYGTLSPEARMYLWEAVSRMPTVYFKPGSDLIDPDDISDENWMRMRWGRRELAGRADGEGYDLEITQIYPRGIPLDAQISALFNERRGVFWKFVMGDDGGVIERLIFSRFGSIGWFHLDDDEEFLDSVFKLALREVVMLSLDGGPLRTWGWYLESAYAHPLYPNWMKVRDMPEDWKRALEIIRERARELYKDRIPP